MRTPSIASELSSSKLIAISKKRPHQQRSVDQVSREERRGEGEERERRGGERRGRGQG